MGRCQSSRLPISRTCNARGMYLKFLINDLFVYSGHFVIQKGRGDIVFLFWNNKMSWINEQVVYSELINYHLVSFSFFRSWNFIDWHVKDMAWILLLLLNKFEVKVGTCFCKGLICNQFFNGCDDIFNRVHSNCKGNLPSAFSSLSFVILDNLAFSLFERESFPIIWKYSASRSLFDCNRFIISNKFCPFLDVNQM